MEVAQRNVFFSMVAGVLFSAGWWVFIGVWDQQIEHLVQINKTTVFDVSDTITSVYNPLWAICSVGTIGLIMVNTVGNSVVQGDGFGVDGQTCLARLYIFTGFLCLFSTLIASIWVMAAQFVGSDNNKAPYRKASTGVALVIQNLLIFVSACVFKFFRSEEAWGGF